MFVSGFEKRGAISKFCNSNAYNFETVAAMAIKNCWDYLLLNHLTVYILTGNSYPPPPAPWTPLPIWVG